MKGVTLDFVVLETIMFEFRCKEVSSNENKLLESTPKEDKHTNLNPPLCEIPGPVDKRASLNTGPNGDIWTQDTLSQLMGQ